MIDDYDDAHFCLKCHETIIGLDNYVTHRKTGCSKTLTNVTIPKSPLPSQLLPNDESFLLKADDFFSSLELQSSSKRVPPPSTNGKIFSGILTRSKTSAAIQAANKDSEITPSKTGKNAWIGGQELKELGTGDNQTRLIKAVDNLTRSSSIKKEEPPKIRVYEEYDEYSDDSEYDDEDYYDYEEVPRTHTGGKWKPSSPLNWNETRDWNSPPPNYTGGKWKPRTRSLQSPPPNHTKGKWKPSSPSSPINEIPPPTFTGSKWTSSKALQRSNYDDIPPPNHTKGKWKPENTWETPKPENKEAPSPSYTKGKWKPEKIEKERSSTYSITEPQIAPFRKSSGTVQYWCGPCNRRLASKIVYERHLKSELHYKRTLQDCDFDDVNHLPKERTTTKPAKFWADVKNNPETSTKRHRKKIYKKCEVCLSKVHSLLMGKHLISHYHCRKGDINTEEAHRLVLENIRSIVLQSPYQCSPCSFYCNTQKDFLRHWLSKEHSSNVSSILGSFICNFCNFKNADNKAMYEHLTSQEHEEVISVINRSVPIVIKKLNTISCETCSNHFLLNIQLKKHCEKANHPLNGTVSDDYQKKSVCRCGAIFKSQIALQRHQRTKHQEKVYICSVCDVTFSNTGEAKLHRQTPEHRYAVLGKKNEQGTGKDITKKCLYCSEICGNVLILKEHLKMKHPEHQHK